MRPAALSKGIAVELEPALGAGQVQIAYFVIGALEAFVEAKLDGRNLEQFLRWPREHGSARAIHEGELAVGIKGENTDRNFFHHLAQERLGLLRAEALLAQRLAERVH